MFHPSILTQINQLGYTYEKEHAEAVQLQQETAFFFKYSSSIMNKLIEQNNRLLEKIRKPTIPDELHTKEVALSDKLAQMTQSYLPKFKELIDSKPLLDKVFDFEQRLIKDLKRLHQLKQDKKQSQNILRVLEKEHQAASQHLSTMKQRLAHCKKLMNELTSLSQHQLN